MANVILELYPQKVAEVIEAVRATSLYRDIRSMYDDGTLQKDQYDKVLISFHEKLLSIAASLTERMLIEGYRLNEMAQLKIDEANARITEIQDRNAREEARNAKEIELMNFKKTIETAQNAREEARNAKEMALLDAQRNTEVSRKSLLDAQRIGFDDNVVIKRASILSDAIGMIQSGGNDAPQAFLDAWTQAIADLGTVARHHPEI